MFTILFYVLSRKRLCVCVIVFHVEVSLSIIHSVVYLAQTCAGAVNPWMMAHHEIRSRFGSFPTNIPNKKLYYFYKIHFRPSIYLPTPSPHRTNNPTLLHAKPLHNLTHLLPNPLLRALSLHKRRHNLLQRLALGLAQDIRLLGQADPRVSVLSVVAIVEELEGLCIAALEESRDLVGGDVVDGRGLPVRTALFALDQPRRHALDEIRVRHEARGELVLALERLRDGPFAARAQLLQRDFHGDGGPRVDRVDGLAGPGFDVGVGVWVGFDVGEGGEDALDRGLVGVEDLVDGAAEGA